jgi:iron complex outermembrane receptor protein
MSSRNRIDLARLRVAGACWALLAGAMPAAAQDDPGAWTTVSGDLTTLGLEDLLNIEVTSVSRHAEPVLGAAAAVFVVTGEDIRRSGARSIAEALRMVPGLFVARIGDINTHSVSSRGFADRLSDKLEVVIDGRTVYTPLFSGVFWDTLDTFMPDIERIEVIRGPGAALWGPNAVNGVINIITKSAADTTGTLIRAGGGTEERSFAGLRSGGRVGGDSHARIYAKHYERDALKDASGNDTFNVARLRQFGLRADLVPATGHALRVSGDAYDGGREDLFEAPQRAGDVTTSGGNVGLRWDWAAAPGSDLSVQAYYDHSERFIPNIVFSETRDMGELSVQHHWALSARQRLVYGASYRESHDVTGQPPLVFIFVPAAETLHYYSLFVQDQIALWPGAELTLGSKFEHNDYTGWEIQPNIRLGARVSDGVFLWSAVSRAARAPSRLDTSLATFNPALRIGNPDQGAEKVIAYEAGMRLFGAGTLSADLALFYNDYDDLRSTEPAAPVPRYGNGLEGYGAGGELALIWQPMESLDTRLFYGYLNLDLRRQPGSGDAGTARVFENASPEHQAGLRAFWQPSRHWSVGGFLRYASALMPTNGKVPAYTELNVRLGWRPAEHLELALVAENLLDRQHPEARTPASYTEVERSALLELNWSWK